MYKSLLFVPGNRPERFDKALASGADTVCIDLEDAVAPQLKAEARGIVADRLKTAPDPRFGVRINSPATTLWEADCDALAGLPLAYVMIPKVESAEQVAAVRARLGKDSPPIWGLMESVRGLREAWDIAASPGVAGLMFGAYDFSAEVGCEPTREALLYARGAIVAAATLAGVDLIDSPWLDVGDDAGLNAEARRAKAMGFGGMACIHPGQVAGVHAVFAPTPEEVDQARRLLDAFDKAEGGVALLDGKLVELPLARVARRTLRKAGITV